MAATLSALRGERRCPAHHRRIDARARESRLDAGDTPRLGSHPSERDPRLSDAGAVYLADQDSDVSELYRIDVAAPGASTKLNGALVAGGEVWDYELAKQ